ncbi:ABC transporter ATP-binding protein [Deinococcus deserti]|uniref:Putative branched-chain amino acid ABC transporter, ATP-binding component n=1 Tax=Deinococcus deserti (strain DSM 17065 / CIP 109153 / LMG 22923 / VCD115) TaxID=546414 RepID=C1CW25_DEIDV|nr:ABC transporter ATP-binding protein [Deinococcus deserti]ACO46392.1 putative branched-chain amino acid ABC transporter, ATP-binding component [Deinococcus deserti VCD115]
MTAPLHPQPHVTPPPVNTAMGSDLTINNVEVVYHDIVQVLRGVSLTVRAGRVTSLLGTNGAGKTTTLRAISGLLKPENGKIREGTVTFEGRVLSSMNGTDVVKSGVVQVPEGRRVFKHLSVEENLRAGAILGRGNWQNDLERIYTYFPKLRMLRNKQAGYTSGGEQQMIAIGRALMAHPKVLLLDEPSLGLAPLLVAEIFDNVRQINRQEGVGVLVVEQNANIALRNSDYGYVMEGGRIVMEGDSAELASNPDVKEFYLGVTEQGSRKSFREVKSYKRRKRWM